MCPASVCGRTSVYEHLVVQSWEPFPRLPWCAGHLPPLLAASLIIWSVSPSPVISSLQKLELSYQSPFKTPFAALIPLDSE